MESTGAAIEILQADVCWDFLRGSAVGRLAVDVGGQPDIFPINYVVHDEALYFRTAAGTKLAAAVLMGNVALEIDGFEPHGRSAWSVVVKGRAHEVERMQELFEAEDLPLFPWVATPKPSIVRIDPERVTGRRFHVVDEVDPDASIGWSGEAGEPGDAADDRARVNLAVDGEPGDEYHPGEPFMRPN
jgi:nitroimidazol reductase NimA-like FMN-containing flavoprotein (pyridoxamine 5'-phosphate oxidase superfamily)